MSDFLFRYFDNHFFFVRITILSDKQKNTIFTVWNWAGGNFTSLGTLAGEGFSIQEF
jgi:hypothetical protein